MPSVGAEGQALLRTYLRTPAVERRVGWTEGPTNSIDHLIDHGYNAHEIAHTLDIPKYLAVERFAATKKQESGETT